MRIQIIHVILGCENLNDEIMRKITFFVLAFFMVSSLVAQVQRTSLSTREASVDVVIDSVTTTVVYVTLTPNDECSKFYALVETEEWMEQICSQFGITVEQGVTAWGHENTETVSLSYPEKTPGTVYTVYVRPYDAAGNPQDLIKVPVTTMATGGEGVSVIELEVTEIAESSVRLIAQANDQTKVFFDGLITTELFDEIGLDSALSIITDPPYPLYVSDNWVWLDLMPGTPYKALAIGQNANDEWGEPAILDFITLGANGLMEILTVANQIYPQPNNGAFVFNGENVEGKTLRIFDLNGKCVFQQALQNNAQNVNASHLPSGQYFVQIGNEKRVVKLMIVK